MCNEDSWISIISFDCSFYFDCNTGMIRAHCDCIRIGFTFLLYTVSFALLPASVVQYETSLKGVASFQCEMSL